MKNILLSAFVLSFLIETHAQSQSTTGMYITNDSVYVSTSTLLYSKDGIVVSENGKLKSEGNVKLDGDLINEGDGSNIVFNFKASGKDSSYGQLQLSQNKKATGKVTMMTNTLNLQSNGFPIIAFPFIEGTDLVSALQSSSLGVSGKIEAKDKHICTSIDKYNDYRYHNYAWFRDNEVSVPMNAERALKSPYLIYTLNLHADKDGNTFSGINKENFTISGVPFCGETSYAINPSLVDMDVTDESSVFYISVPMGKFPERYNNHISDFIDHVDDDSWGHNLFGFGNPYTQNINLFELLNKSNFIPSKVKGIAMTAGMTLGEEDEQGRLYSNYRLKSNVMTCTGDEFSSASCSSSTGGVFSKIRPFGTFNLKLTEDFNGATIVFNDQAKTFSYHNLGITDESKAMDGYQPNSASFRKASSKAIEELSLFLKDDKGEIKGSVALSANPWAKAAVDKKLDAVAGDGTINGESRDIALYLLNEKDNLGSTKLSINGFNMSTYRGKPLQIVLSTIPGQRYTLVGSVRIAEKINLPYTHFFIEDKQEKEIMRVGADFSYSFSASDNDSNRFVAYYAKVPVDVKQKQVEKVKVKSIDIAMDSAGEHVIVFKGQTGDATVHVYDMLKQLPIFSDYKVNTSSNYSLNFLSQGGVYFVKVINNEGKVITKKITK